jgi:hypothetical protein
LASGHSNYLGLRSDGSIAPWGANIGQQPVPPPNTDFVVVASAGYVSFGIKTGGSIVAWGEEFGSGQLNIPAPNDDFVAVDGGNGHGVGLKADGTIVAWGIEFQSQGQLKVALPNERFIAVSASDERSTAIRMPATPSTISTPKVPVAGAQLMQNIPNPFNPTTQIHFLLVERQRVVLSIYDVSGRLVRTLIDDVRPSGSQSVSWDGRDSAGRVAASGVYFYRLRAGNFDQSRKMLLLK